MTTPQTIPGTLRRAAELWGDRPAVVDGATTLTFEQLLEQVREAARGYVALGLRPGERVALWAPNGWEWIVAGLAISYAGGTLTPLNTRYKGFECVDVIDRTEATLVVLANGFLGRNQLAELRDAAAENGTDGTAVTGLPHVRAVVTIGDGGENTVAFTELGKVGAAVEDIDAIADAVSPDDIADVLFTSGTTGKSKGALSRHSQTLAAGAVWASTCKVVPEDRYLVISPFFHSYGYKVGIIVSILSGCALYPMAAFDVEEALRWIEKERITIFPGAPTVFTSLLESPSFGSTDTSSLRLANMGSASIPSQLIERMRTELSFELVVPAFGMTECVVATMCREDDSDEVVNTTNGRVVDGLEMRIVDVQTGEEQPPNVSGELLFRGPMVMEGYLDDPEATAQAIDKDGWLHTGDIAQVDESGNMKITDRLKDMYISGGFNVYPAEIEQVLARLDGVIESAVVGVPDARMGEVGKAYITLRAGSQVTEDDVIAFARERLANFKIPRYVEFLEEFPRNISGKVLKTELRTRS